MINDYLLNMYLSSTLGNTVIKKKKTDKVTAGWSVKEMTLQLSTLKDKRESAFRMPKANGPGLLPPPREQRDRT